MTLAPDPWQTQAACRTEHADLFFSDDTTDVAVRVCRTSCPVRVDCLRDALKTGERYGVRGGLTARQRALRYPAHMAGAVSTVTVDDDIKHGTPAGYKAHYRRGSTPCDACRIAESNRDRNRSSRRRSA